jgi:hypothetical protein
MTYSILFWCPTKTINFFRCSWLIDIKSVRKYQLWYSCLKNNGLKQKDSTVPADSQVNYQLRHTLIMHGYYPMCTLSFIFALVCSLLEVNLCMVVFIVCLNMYCRWRSRLRISLTGLIPPHLHACPKIGPRFLTSYVMVLFCVQWVEARDECPFCLYWWNCWPSLLNFSFHNREWVWNTWTDLS